MWIYSLFIFYLFSIKFPKIPGVLKGHQPNPKDGSRKDRDWDYQGVCWQNKPENDKPIIKDDRKPMMNKLRRSAGSMSNVFHQQRYKNLTVEEAIPLDSISCISSDHIYAELNTPPGTPPLLPPRPDTPITNQAPDYPPYSSLEVVADVERRPRPSSRRSRNREKDGSPFML